MKEVNITLRIDSEVEELLLEVDGRVENEQDITALLGFMSNLAWRAIQYGGNWVPTTRLIETRRNQFVYTFAFPDITAKEQFQKELYALDQKTVP